MAAEISRPTDQANLRFADDDRQVRRDLGAAVVGDDGWLALSGEALRDRQADLIDCTVMDAYQSRGEEQDVITTYCVSW